MMTLRRFKNLLTILVLMVVSRLPLSAQRPYWEMMQDSIVDFDATVEAFELYWQGRKPEKGQGYNVFRRWQYHQELRREPDGTLPPVGYEAAEMMRWEEQMKGERRTNTVPTGNWTPMGPIAMPTNNTGQPGGIGRLTSIAFHPTDPNTLYVGAANGGMWMTTDQGSTWTTTTDFNPTLGVSSIAVDPGNTNIIYIGTGDKDGGDASGLGVYKTTNGGTTWAAANTGMGNRTVHCLAMDPNNSAVITASTSNGLYRTTNNGATWAQVLASGTTYEVRYRVGSNSTLYAVNTQRFYTSTDDGATWNAGVVVSTAARSAFALAAGDPDLVYMVKNVGTNQVFKSTDAGATWTNVQTDGKNLMNSSCAGTGTGGQGGYDICIAVDPTNVNTVIVGGVSLWKSTDGGVNFSITGCWSSMVTNIHADHHWLALSPHFPNRLYICNDGGLYYTDNFGSSYSNISSGLAISQIYRVGVSGNRTDVAVAGLQDNGMLITRQPNWLITVGGDGTECAIDPTDNNYQYGSYVNGVIRRSTNGGYNWSSIDGPITETGPWLTPYVLQPGNPNVMIAGYVSLWRSTDVKSVSPTWTNVQAFASSTIRDIHFADANTVYAARSNNEFWRSQDGGVTWVQRTSPAGPVAEDIAADPTNPDRVWVAAGNDIYRSLDGGATWTIWDTGLPNVAALTVVYDKVADALYCGMWVGVYYRGASDASWTAFNTGLPNTQAHHLQIYYDASGCVGRDKLRLATYGRGLWESDLRAGSTLPPVACFGYTPTMPCAQSQVITLVDSSGYDPTSWLWTISGPGTATFVNATSNTSQAPQITIDLPGAYTVTLQVTNANGSDTETRVGYIIVTLPPVSFTSPDSLIYLGQPTNFVDASSTCAFSWLWDFGDGNTSTQQNPTHTYAAPGYYTVNLSINGGVNNLTRTNFIQVLPHLNVPYTSNTVGWAGDMESAATAWHFGDKRISGTSNPFERGSVTLTFPAAASGTQCWATDLDANVPMTSYSTAVHTPTFNFSAPGKYQVRLKNAMQSAFCNAPLAAAVQYTTDLGATWTRLGGKQGTDPAAQAGWYDKGGTGGCDNADVIGSPFIGWNFSGLTFRQAIYDASALAGNASVGFRVAFFSSSAYGAFISKGFAFDDFEVDYVPTPAPTDTIPGSLVAFDGVDDYVETYYQGNLPAFTLEGWVMSPAAPSSAARSSILQKSNSIEFNWNHPTAASRGAVALRNTVGTWQNYSFGALAANTWYHLAVTFDGTNVVTYKNGVVATSGTFTGTLTTNTSNIQLGIGSAFFNGQLDEFRIWNTARTQLQIREAMHRTLDAAECTNVVLYYQGNETSGYLKDPTNLRNGYLMAGLGRSLSPIAVGRGVSQTMTVSAPGMHDFTIPDIKLDFTAAAGTPFDVTVTRINQFVNQQTPNPVWNAAPNLSLVDRTPFFYHVVNKFGGGAFAADVTVEGVPDFSSMEAASPVSVKWVKRASNSTGLWDVGIGATAVTQSSGWNGTARFVGITTFSQAFLGSELMDVFPIEGVSLAAIPDPGAGVIHLLSTYEADAAALRWTLERGASPEDLEAGRSITLASIPAQAASHQHADADAQPGLDWYYRLRGVDANGMVQFSPVVTARLDLGRTMQVYPNPSTGIVHLAFIADGRAQRIEVADMQGRIVWQDEAGSTEGPVVLQADLSRLSQGMYMIRVNEGAWTKLVKE